MSINTNAAEKNSSNSKTEPATSAKTSENKISEFRIKPGDLVRVNSKVKEGNRERIQSFEGIIIAMGGSKESKTFTIRKIASGGVGVERIWPLNSPLIVSIEMKKPSKMKRAKLYYLRGRIGKAAMNV